MPATNDDPDSFGDRGPLLRWLVFTGLSIFAFVLLWRAMKSRKAIHRAGVPPIMGPATDRRHRKVRPMSRNFARLRRPVAIRPAAARSIWLFSPAKSGNIEFAPLPLPILPPKDAP